MRARWASILVIGLAIVVGCKRKPAATEAGSGGITEAPIGAAKSNEKTRRGTFTIGKATTYITGPVDRNGHIDYAAALNERLSEGVTPGNNANVLIWKAIGPHPEGVTMPGRFFELLGIPALPAQGEYFITLRRFVEDHLNGDTTSASALLDKLRTLAKRPWTESENHDIAGWLKANEKPLALVVEATRRTHYYSPLVRLKPLAGC